ncbi:hypothetical protein CTI12_AA238970 [Artemisia annua]|uniref:Uncharacterized protein n=1 Tax=Artemisia annua TaxID=35608 RepID=A0A2U1NMS9_ARTAN|nr:hypothetical protein CTI12_AA238970 [Artemisia annua]
MVVGIDAYEDVPFNDESRLSQIKNFCLKTEWFEVHKDSLKESSTVLLSKALVSLLAKALTYLLAPETHSDKKMENTHTASARTLYTGAPEEMEADALRAATAAFVSSKRPVSVCQPTKVSISVLYRTLASGYLR